MSLKALQTAVTGMNAQQTRIDNIANNLANINTIGFKKSNAEFEDLMYDQVKTPGTKNSSEAKSPVGIQVGHGTKLVSVYKQFTQGEFVQSGRELDVAVEGQGFVKVLLDDGTEAYTRDGSFKLDSDGNMVTSNGYKIDPAITIPQQVTSITIGRDGTVSVTKSGENAASELGRLQLTLFMNPSGLKYMGKGLYKETDSSGSPTQVNPGENGGGTLMQGYVENSNVNVADELINMVVAQRTYEANSRVIQTANEMMRNTTNMG